MLNKHLIPALVQAYLWLRIPEARTDERGAGDAVESAVIAVGLVTIALLVVGVMTGFVQDKLSVLR